MSNLLKELSFDDELIKSVSSSKLVTSDVISMITSTLKFINRVRIKRHFFGYMNTPLGYRDTPRG